MGYRFGPFQIDIRKRRLLRGHDLIPLTPKAFDTLLVLVSHAGQIVEKDDILRAVWQGTFVEESTLAQNISTLRKALGDPSDAPIYIATVPRRGYRFLEQVADYPDESEEVGRSAVVPVSAASTPPLVPSTFPTRERFWIVTCAALAAGLIVAGVSRMWTSVPSVIPVVFAIAAPTSTSFSTSGSFMAVAPDGGSVAFIASAADGTTTLWLRRLDGLSEQPLPGTEGASQPFWSHDSRFVAFFANGKLNKVDIAHGTPQTICELPPGAEPRAGAWNRRGDILFAIAKQGIVRVSADGGIATPLIDDNATDFVEWPQFLPDDRHFLYLLNSVRPDASGVYVGVLGSGDSVRVADVRSYAQYSPTGHLLFIRDGVLMAQPFDVRTFQLREPPVPVAHEVAFNEGTARGTFSLSQTGVLAYRSVAESRLLWFARDGTQRGEVGRPGGYLQFSLSPDGSRVAAARLNPQTGGSDIWIINAAGDERRLTFDPSWNTRPVWSADGAVIAYESDRGGRRNIYAKAAGGDGPDERLVGGESPVFPQQWLRDGRLLFRTVEHSTKGNFWLLARGRPTPERLAVLEADEEAGQISPDGRWLAYTSYDDAAWAVNVRPVSSIESRWEVAPEGAEPRWRGDGKELYYLSPELALMAAPIEEATSFRWAQPHLLFKTHAVAPNGLAGQAYDVSADGTRFLVKVRATSSSITVVVNSTALFRRPH